MEPRKYTKKPVTITAVLFDGGPKSATRILTWILREGGTARYVGVGENHPSRRPEEVWGDDFDEMPDLEKWRTDAPWREARPDAPDFIVIDTLEGALRADHGDQIIRGIEGEFYPCKPDIFDKTYERAPDKITGDRGVEDAIVVIGTMADAAAVARTRGVRRSLVFSTSQRTETLRGYSFRSVEFVHASGASTVEEEQWRQAAKWVVH